MNLTIVIPAFNEEEAIASIIERTLVAKEKIERETAVAEVHVVVVSDGSFDRTEEIARSYEGIRLVAYPNNKGYGAAIKIGFAQTEDEWVGFLDADGTCDPDFFVKLIRHQQQTDADIVLGSRLGNDSEMPRVRRVGNVFFATLVNLWAGTRIKDTASGMRLIRRSVLRQLSPLPDSLHFTPAMSAKALFDRKIRIEEIPMNYRERVGESKLHVLRDGILFLLTIIEAAVSYRPRRMLTVLGLLMLLAAAGLSLQPIHYYLTEGEIFFGMVYRLVTILVLLNTGILIVGMGYVCQRFLDLLHYEQLEDHGWTGRFEKFLLSHGMLVGSGLLLVAAALLVGPFFELLRDGAITAHWFQVMAGTFVFASAFQFICFGFAGLISLILHINFRDRKRL